MLSLNLPLPARYQRFLELQRKLPFSYTQQHASRENIPVAGFDNDYLRVSVGKGQADFERAKMAIRQWEMFPKPWTQILPENAPIATDTVVAMYARFSGVWWRNACRLVYTIDAADRFGFAYGTLPGHVECGEELFLVSIDPDETVWYELRAFSRPRHWTARLGYPLVRWLQARFRRDSAAQMLAFVQKKGSE